MSESIDTLVLHAGAESIEGAISTPVFHSTTYAFEDGTPYEEINYSRLSTTPNHRILEERLRRVMDVERALVCGSGMAAISLTFETLVPIGATVVVAETLYGGTLGLLRWLEEARDLTVRTFDATAEGALSGVDPEVSLVYAETVSNPRMEVARIDEIAEWGKRNGVPTVIDNTFGSPIAVRPASFGIDIVIHSATKYLNGHSDVAAGVVGGREDYVSRIAERRIYHGSMLDPGACYLLERGLKTLGIRVRRQSESAATLAGWLEAREEIANVLYPFLDSENAYARRLLKHGGGMLAVEVAEDVELERFFADLEYWSYAPSLGGVESLIVRPAASTHALISPADRLEMGISERLVRLSVGLEDSADLISDLNSALTRARGGQ